MSFIEFDGKKIYYQKKGQGKPVLFGHSFLWNTEMWSEVTDLLQENYLCVLVDLPGHGKSESVADITLDKLTAIHKAVMLHLGYPSFSLVGLSIGAMWGSLLCSDDEVDVEHFVVMNSSLSPEPDEKRELYLGMLSLIENTGQIPEPLIEQIAPGFFSAKYMEQHIDTFKESLKDFTADQIEGVAGCGKAFVQRSDLLLGLKEFKNTVSVIAGEFDYYRSIQEADLISDLFQTETVIIPAGHISAKEIPQKVSVVLVQLLG